MRIGTVVKAGLLAAAAAAAALIATVKSFDSEWTRRALSNAIGQATGRPAAISGGLSLKMGLTPTLTIPELSLAGKALGRTVSVRAGRVEAQLALLPLLARQLVVRRLAVADADIVFDSSGRTTAPPPVNAAPVALFDLTALSIRDSRLHWMTKSGRKISAVLASADLRPDGPTGTQSLMAAGSFGDKPFTLAGTVGALAPRRGQPWPLRVNLTYAGALATFNGNVGDPVAWRGLGLDLHASGENLGQVLAAAGLTTEPLPLGPFLLAGRLGDSAGAVALDVTDAALGKPESLRLRGKGRIADVGSLGGVDLIVDAHSDTLANLSRLAGSALPPTGPLDMRMHVQDTVGGWQAMVENGRLGQSAFTGQVTVPAEARPLLTGRLAWPLLSLSDLFPPDDRAPPPVPPSLALPFDADLSVAAARLRAGRIEFSNVGGRLHLTRGRMDLPLTANLAQGVVAVEAVLTAPADMPALAVRAEGRNIDLGQLIRDATGSTVMSGGRTRLHVNLRGSGPSLAAIGAGLDGDGVVAVGEAALAGLTMAANIPSPEGGDSQLRCAVARFTLHGGVAATDRGLAAEFPKASIVGSGTVNLATRAVDLHLLQRAVGNGGSAVRIGGSLSAPQIGGEAAAPAFPPDPHPCRTALGKGGR